MLLQLLDASTSRKGSTEEELLPLFYYSLLGLARNLSLAFRTQFRSPILATNFATHPPKGHSMRILRQRLPNGFLYDSESILGHVSLA